MAKNEEYIFYRKNGKLMRFPKNGKTTLFRGLTQKYDPDYDKSKLDNPNGYESWTDSYDLAKEYAGENGYVYSTEVPNKDLNTEDIYDENGDRSLVYWNDKPVALHGVEGEEFMLYTDHEDHDKLDYKEISTPSKDKKKDFEERISLIKSIHSMEKEKGEYDNLIKDATNGELKNLKENLERKNQIDKEGQDNYLRRRTSEKLAENFGDEKTNELQNKANDIVNKLREQRSENDKIEEKRQKPDLINEYKNAIIGTDLENNKIVRIGDQEIKMLDKKEYKKISKDFADSLNEKETSLIQDYVDAPGYSGELNDYDEYDEKYHSGTRYLYNTTNENLFISRNELNKYYSEMQEKYMKEVGTELNATWPTPEQKQWAAKVLGTDDYNRTDELLKGISRRDPNYRWADKEDFYYTPKEVEEFKETYEKLKPLYDKQRQYNYNDPEYNELQEQMKKINKTGYGIYQLQNLSQINDEQIFNTKDYDFEKYLEEGKIKYISAKELNDLKEYSPYQSSYLIDNKENITKKLNDFNKLFDEKGVVLDHDIVVFRRGRESDEQINKGFTKDGVISTSAFDTLPKKMPSGNKFGDKKYYILLPSGSKILFLEQVIGRGYEDKPDYDDVWRGVKRQHEILLRPGTHFSKLSVQYDYKDGDNILLLAEEEK